METLWSNMSDCGRCQAWSTPTRFKESLNYLNIKYTSPFRFQIRSSVLSLQVAMNFPVAAMPIPITSVRCTCQQNLHLQHIGLPYLGESYCHTKISQSPVSLLGHFVNLWTWYFFSFELDLEHLGAILHCLLDHKSLGVWAPPAYFRIVTEWDMVWGYFTKRPWSNSTLQRRGLCSLAENSLQCTRIIWFEAALCLLGAPNHNSLILCTSGQMPPIGADIKIHHPPTVALNLFLHSEKTFKQTFSDVTSHGCLNVSFSFVFFSGFFFDFGGAGPEAGGGDDFTSASSATSIISSFTCDRAADCGFLFAKKQKQENQVFPFNISDHSTSDLKILAM